MPSRSRRNRRVADEGLGEKGAGAAIEVFSAGQRAYLHPRGFADVLDLWGARLLTLSPAEQTRMNSLLETLMDGGAALMEAGRNAVTLRAELAERLEAAPFPAAAFSESGTLLAANMAASDLLEIEPGQLLSTRAHTPSEAARIDEILRRAADNADRSDRAAVIALTDADGAPALFELKATRSLDGGDVLLLARGLGLRLDDSALTALQRIFGLTEAEAAIARCTVEGLSPAEIAARRRTSVETVRTQMKSLREKTGARTQLEILRLTAGLGAADAAAPAVPHALGGYAMPRRHNLTLLSGGRRIEHARHGAPDGAPVVVLHAALHGFRWPPALLDPLLEAGYTLHTPVRPGYGLSTRVESMDFEREVDMLAEYVDKLGLGTYRIVTQGVSSGVGAALARRHHNRVLAVANIAGYLPIDLPGASAAISDWQRAVLNAASVSPKLLRLTAAMAHRMIRSLGTSEFYARSHAGCPPDQAAAAAPESIELLQTSLNLLRAQKLEGMAADFPRVLNDWTAIWEALRAPTLQIHGGANQIFPPDCARRLCDDHPSLRFELIEDGGQMLAYSHPEAVAALLLTHFGGPAAGPPLPPEAR